MGPLMATWCGGVVVVIIYSIIDVDRVTWPINDNVGIVIADVVNVGGMCIIVIDNLGDMPCHCQSGCGCQRGALSMWAWVIVGC